MRRPRIPRPLLAAAAVLPVLCASACTGGSAEADAGRGPVHITFWSALRGSQEVVDAYNKTHDDIHVDFQQVPSGAQGGYAKLSNAARAGNAPDVATIEYPQLPEFAIDGVARDISPMVGKRLREKLLPQAFSLTTFENRVFSVPLDVEPMVLIYRKDLFKAAGVQPPRTWGEFEDAARTVKKERPHSRIVNLPTDGGPHLAALSWQAGARWFDTRGGAWHVSLTDAPTRKVMTYWQRLIDRDLVFANPGESQQGDAQLGNGEVLAKLTGAWDAGALMSSYPEQKGKWAVAPMPQWDPDKPRVGTLGGSTFAVTKDSRNPKAAMDFIEWQVTSPDALRARLSSGLSSQYPAAPGLLPTARKAMDTSFFGGQDIYRTFRREAELISGPWMWGPRMTATLKTVQDGSARASAGSGSLLEALREGQRATMPDLEALGLRTTESRN
ncbi:sugar ABC transporter substrate-binding protein [Streptomyces albidus (ex Kaewkla and Franco 2022)]|uniref:ABC transporter substrate-binding protein n=1 Tax=Streptomyces albidus (ex Kaewkla and Franco 2022) TaxID=722709 RepID=UPI00281552CA|nr:sugar ABC transporter substrate-binding protein [Streptomyces albidus (ex Kaewkla and Franco 2022)]